MTTNTHPHETFQEAAVRELARRHRWWAGRVIALPVQMAVFAVVVFFIIRLVPGDPVLAATGGHVSEATYVSVKDSLGLNGSVFHQLLTYLSRIAHGDLGRSAVSDRPVSTELINRLPVTLQLAVLGSVAAAVFALLASYLVVMRPRNVLSRGLAAYARTAGAIPDYCVGVAGIFLLYASLHLLPAPLGPVDASVGLPPTVTHVPLLDALLSRNITVIGSELEHLVLPVLVMVVTQSAVLIKMLVIGLEEALDAAPTRFRIACGASDRALLLSIYRRALPPATTMFGTIFAGLLGGVVILEQLFNYAGMGSYAVNAVNAKDLDVMQGFLLVVAFLSLLVFFAVDIVNMLLDPRRRPGVSAEAAA